MSDQSQTPLLPCPFCGQKPFERWEDNINGPKYPGHHFVWCENLDCGVGGEAMEETKEAAIKSWNTRAANPSPSDIRQEDVREALDNLESILEQVQDCIRGDTPEDMSDAEARNDTIGKIREGIFELIPALRAALSAQTGEPVTSGTFDPQVAGFSLAAHHALCSDCPPDSYPTDITRCAACPRRSNASPPPQPDTAPVAGREALEAGKAFQSLMAQLIVAESGPGAVTIPKQTLPASVYDKALFAANRLAALIPPPQPDTAPSPLSTGEVRAGWHDGSEIPPVRQRSEQEFIVAVRRASNGKVYSFAASYLNATPLQYDWGCPRGNDEDKCKECTYDGCPTTGWYRLTGNDGDGGSYESLHMGAGDVLLGWRTVPSWDETTLSQPPATEQIRREVIEDAAQIVENFTLAIVSSKQSPRAILQFAQGRMAAKIRALAATEQSLALLQAESKA